MGQLSSRVVAGCLFTLALVGAARGAHAQVFTVGEKTATADIKTDFTRTHVELPDQPMSERGRRDLIRNFTAEQGFCAPCAAGGWAADAERERQHDSRARSVQDDGLQERPGGSAGRPG